MWKFLIILAIFLIVPSAMAENVSNVTTNVTLPPVLTNLTCPIKYCTSLLITILNKTFIPNFNWNLLGINCSIVPIQTNILSTSKHQMTCDFPLLNYSSQEEFEKAQIPVPVFYFRTLQNISIDYVDYTKIRSELPFWQAGFILLAIVIIGYVVWQRFDESQGD